MSVFGPNQVEELIIGNAVAAEVTIPTFIASASDKEIGVQAANAGALALGSDFKILQKTGGTAPLDYEFSDTVEAASVKSVNVAAYQAEVAKQVTVSGIPGSELANTTYEVFVRIMEDGGSVSAENFRFLYGNFVSKSAVPTADDIADGIVETLQKSANASDPGRFVITKEAGQTVQILSVIEPGGKADKGFGRPMYFDVQVASKSNGNDPATGVSTEYDFLVATVDSEVFAGVGTAKYVEALEWFTKGYKYESYRETAYPVNFSVPYYVDLSKTYNVIHILYKKDRQYTNVERQNKTLTIAVEADGGVAATNAVLAQLRTVLGTSIVPADLV